MRKRWLNLLALYLAAPGCGPTGAGQIHDFMLPEFSDEYREYCAQTSRSLTFDQRLANVLIVFDRSGSMQTAFGAGTRFSVEAAILKDMLLAYENRIRFGFQQFPRPGGCGGGTPAHCCVDPPVVPVGMGQASAIGGAIDRAAPVDGNTPTAGALQEAASYFAALDDGIADRYVLLVTDGQPSCDQEGFLSRDVVTDAVWTLGPCHDALQAIDVLRNLGVKVIVMGVGEDLNLGMGAAASCLEMMGRAGGVHQEGTGPDGVETESFFHASHPLALERLLQNIFGGVTRPSCILRLQNAPETLDRVALFFDGHEVPRDVRRVQGWDFLPGQGAPTVQLFGDACRRLERFQVAEIEIRHGCPPCTDIRLCE